MIATIYRVSRPFPLALSSRKAKPSSPLLCPGTWSSRVLRVSFQYIHVNKPGHWAGMRAAENLVAVNTFLAKSVKSLVFFLVIGSRYQLLAFSPIRFQWSASSRKDFLKEFGRQAVLTWKCFWAFQEYEGSVLISEHIDEDYLNLNKKAQPLLQPSYSSEILIDFIAAVFWLLFQQKLD